ncbi:MAG: hypothetical protein ACTSRP_05510 [Candidatus Helarchaeota archaeon]
MPSQLLKLSPKLLEWVKISLFKSSLWAFDRREGLSGVLLNLMTYKSPLLKVLS